MEKRARLYISVILVLLLAAFVRFYKLNWDSTEILDPSASFHAPLIAHPDERGFLNRVQKLGVEDWNPRTYGPLPLYVMKFASMTAAKWIDPAWSEYRHTVLIGRFLSACFGWATVLLTFLLGRRLHSTGAGVFAAFLLAANVLHIQASHFAAPDTFLTFFAQLTLLLAVLSLQNRSLAVLLLCGMAAGLAAASKFNGIGLLPVVVVAAFWNPHRWKAVAVSLGSLLLAFFCGAPYALLDPSSFWGRIAVEQGRAAGSSMPWNVQQYIPTRAFLYPLEQIMVWGFGVPAGLLALAGVIWGTGVVLRSKRTEESGATEILRSALILMLVWVIPNFLLTSFSQIRLPRYLLPFYPQLCLLGALMIAALIEGQRLARTAALTFAAVAAAGSFLWMLAFLQIYSLPHPYIQATQWARQQVTAGAKIALEDMNEEVPVNLQNRYRMGVRLPMFQLPDSADKVRYFARVLSLADYLSLPNLAVSSTILLLDTPHKNHPGVAYPYGAAMYRLLFSGGLGYAREAEFTRYPSLLGWEINDDPVDLGVSRLRYRCDQSFTLYDHPRTILFRNKDRLSEEEIYSRLMSEARQTLQAAAN